MTRAAAAAVPVGRARAVLARLRFLRPPPSIAPRGIWDELCEGR
jgi:hypothetical protein